MEYIKEILLDAGAMNGIYGVVIHNDAGSRNGKQYVEWLKNRDLTLGIAHGYRDWETDRKSTRLNSSHSAKSRMPSSA